MTFVVNWKRLRIVFRFSLTQIGKKIFEFKSGLFFFENRLQHALHLAEERERVLKIELVQTETARADTLERYKDIKEQSRNSRGQFFEMFLCIEKSIIRKLDSSKIMIRNND